MKIITEDHIHNYWLNVKIPGGMEVILSDDIFAQDLIDRGLAKKAEEKKETKMEEYKSQRITATIKGGKNAK